jgi:hypothetical protein
MVQSHLNLVFNKVTPTLSELSDILKPKQVQMPTTCPYEPYKIKPLSNPPWELGKDKIVAIC